MVFDAHDFEQVRAQSKRIESELEEARENATRIEAEKAVLEERVEVEGAERVTVVASVSQERDFLLRQASISAQKAVFCFHRHVSARSVNGTYRLFLRLFLSFILGWLECILWTHSR